jgi:DNA gyrase subunit A
MMATRKGLVKKTPLEDYSRPKKGGIIAIKLREDDEVVDVVVTKPGDELILSSAGGMAIRFSEADARPMGRNTSGVKGIGLMAGDTVVGMVVADPEATLLTVCEKGYGKRTNFGPNSEGIEGPPPADEESGEGPAPAAAATESIDEAGDDEGPSGQRYRTQRRGGKGLRDIKTTDRNGRVIGIARVDNTDEVLMMTARGKIQRIAAADISVIGRNTQGVRIMSLDEGDSLVAITRVPPEEVVATDAAEPPKP